MQKKILTESEKRITGVNAGWENDFWFHSDDSEEKPPLFPKTAVPRVDPPVALFRLCGNAGGGRRISVSEAGAGLSSSLGPSPPL